MLPEEEIFVPKGSYFVMGDNNESFDSRYIEVGFLRHEDVVGRAYFRIWPLHRIGIP